MKGTQQRQQGKKAFDLIEESTHLLRTAPTATLAVYFLGAIPFVLGLLFFWADMSRSPLAPQHLAGGSLGMAALFLWMKFWQVSFVRRIRAQAAGESWSPPGIRPCLRILLAQAAIQPTGLFLLPLALLPVLPFGWVYAFYQNVTALGEGTENGASALMKNARRQAALWPGQNHLALIILLGFAGCVFLNLATVCFALPHLCKMLFGIESVFTQSPLAMLNSTFFAAMFGLTYLCVDPVFKTVYALRCFYGESLESGKDLKADLKPFVNSTGKTVAAILIVLAIFPTSRAPAESIAAPVAPPASQTISPPQLDRTINQTIHEPKYVWRMPREKIIEAESKSGVVMQFFESVGTLIGDWVHTIMNWLGKVLEKLFRHSRSTPTAPNSFSYGRIMWLQILLYGLVVAVVAALAVFFYRVWRARRLPPPAVKGEAILPTPDLADENIRADHLPEDGWTRLARELLDRGEYRLAMRAFYLAGLAHLAARNLISIARFKSNRDYERELRRRAHALPTLLAIFGDNLSVFERSWYGLHEANRDVVTQFAANIERLKAGE